MSVIVSNSKSGLGRFGNAIRFSICSLLTFFCLLFIFWLLVSYWGISYTYTGSLPSGIYVRSEGGITRGALVSFDPNKDDKLKAFLDEFAIRGSKYIWMKKVVGMPGDRIDISSDHVIQVNGQKLCNAKVFRIKPKRDVGEFHLVQYPFTVPSDEYYVLGTNQYSLDSRYFGTVSKRMILEVNEPLLTW
ncbi:signal peptidase I [Planctomycetota bacterium]|nr:signal peptidase I [Planctomycetota bacterium]